MSESLEAIFARIRARAEAVEEAFDSWPCRAGCDHCCRHLHRVPEAAAEEWKRFERGLDALDDGRRATVLHRIEHLRTHEDDSHPGPIVCPALDRDRGRCLVYVHRPAACRSYGYYRSRAHDLWCGLVERHVDAEEPSRPVVWGNQDSLERRLRARFGEPIAMTDWFARDRRRRLA